MIIYKRFPPPAGLTPAVVPGVAPAASGRANQVGVCMQILKKEYFCTVAVALLLFGCGEQVQKPLPICPGRESAAEALSVLQSHLQNASPLKASGSCVLQYYAEGKQRAERFPVKLWLNPPQELFLQGDVAFDPQGVVLGTNQDEFWLAIRLKEVSSYWWGRWQETGQFNQLVIDPKMMLEGLGIPALDSDKSEDWSFTKQGAFDVLTMRSDQAVPAKGPRSAGTKRIHIYSCDYLVRKIEYLDIRGQAAVVAELDKYEQVRQDFFVPTIVKIIHRGASAAESVTITVTLTSVKSADITSKLRTYLFTRPEPKGFKHIYRVLGGKVVEEQPEP
jgi:hypothetical protein